jgi:hypothetical protein
MKIVGAGLSKTGTTSLHRALKILGYKSLHFDRKRLREILEGSNSRPDFRRYDDVDAVLDIPAAYFFEEILDAYPHSKCILTIRNENDWWRSVEHHFNVRFPIPPQKENTLRSHVRNYIYGSTTAYEFLYRKKYREHNERVLLKVPSHRLLVMDVAAGDGWEKLCPFLDREIPPEPFPHAHKTPRDENENLTILMQEITARIPLQEAMILVDDGCWGDKIAPNRRVIPFLERDGQYFGKPANDEMAIRELERLRQAGAGYIIFAWPAFWWLEYYSAFHQHLRSHFQCIFADDRAIFFQLGLKP